MKIYSSSQIRNIGFIGHGGEGKTTLTEAMLFASGAIDRMGKVDDGSTITDYDAEETKRHISIGAGLAPVEWKDCKINIIDTPGYFDFEGEVIQALRVIDSALIVVGAVSGLTVGSVKAWDMCKKSGLPRAFVVNRMDTENANYEKVFSALSDKFGPSVVPLHVPIMEDSKFVGYVDVSIGKAFMFDAKGDVKEAPIPSSLEAEYDDYREKLSEAVAESDEALMEKFFEGEPFTNEELIDGIRAAVASCALNPIFCAAAPAQVCVKPLMNALASFMPTPSDGAAMNATNLKTGDRICVKTDESAPFSAFVFKTVADNFVGKISLIKVCAGVLKSDSAMINSAAEKLEKVGTVYYMKGKKTYPIDKLCAGDIGALAKLQGTSTGNTLCDPANPITFEDFKFPTAAISMAVSAKKSGEEDKVFAGLYKLMEEDCTVKVEKHKETGDVLLSGLGEMHLDIICGKLKNKFNVEAKLDIPCIPYRETIRKTSEAQGRHKKQSGGSGQFGDVWIRFEPIMDGSAEFEFVDKVVGGSVPRNFIPAVEKGLREAVVRGVLASYPVINIRCTLYDGSSHAVDSNEMAFKIAARLAYKKGCAAASPVLLEPIYRYDVYVPDEYMGDIIGDMNRRRGRIMGMNPTEDGGQKVVAEVPFAEMFKYATDLRSMTQGRGRYEAFFERYEDVPANIAQKVIESNKKDDEE